MTENENITKLNETAAREAILDYQKKTGKTQDAISIELGFNSGSALSQFIKGTYATPHTMTAKIERLLKISEKKEASPKKPGFKMTSVSQQVTDLITLCHIQGEMGVAYGDPGVGKTMAVRQYAVENPDAIVITVSPTNATITGVNELIADKLKIKDEKLTRRITALIIEKLKGSKRVIIIDEAQHLKARVVNHLRSIVDATYDDDSGEQIGMALIGNDEIYHELKIRQAAAYGQIADRIIHWAHLSVNGTKVEDIRLIFTDANLNDEAINVLHTIGKAISVRKAVHVFTNTIVVFKIQNNEDITAAKLARVAKEMNIRIAN